MAISIVNVMKEIVDIINFLTEKGHEMMPIIMSILVEITDDLIEGLTEERRIISQNV